MNDNITVIEVSKEYESSYHRHANNIARHLRKADNDELSELLNCLPEDDVMEGYYTSNQKWIVIRAEDKINVPIALFGVTPHLEYKGVGIPWMVATDGLTKIATFLMKNYGKYLDIMKGKYDILVNYVDVRNTDSIKWLKHIGFQFDEAAPLKEGGLPFHRFYMECK